jgi:hypothetical protein
MAFIGSTEMRARIELAGDGALISAGISSALLGAVLLAAVPFTGEVPVWIQLLSAAAMFVMVVGGPVATWFVYGRRVTLPAVLGVIVGGPVTGAVFFLFVGVSRAVGWLLQTVNDADWFGPLVTAALAMISLLAWVTALAVRGVMDLRRPQPEHKRLDIWRMASWVVLLVFGIAVTVVAIKVTGEIAEAPAFAMLAAVSGGISVFTADLMTSLMARKELPAAVPAPTDAEAQQLP